MAELSFRAPAFICPTCNIYSTQSWTHALEQKPGSPTPAPYTDLYWGTCLKCNNRTIWFRERLVAPVATSAPPPNPDMPADILVDYEEARDISERSPRSAAGLLRLCIQRLCVHLGEPGKNLNNDIGALVAKGLPVQIQQAFDAVRIIGNSQLHPEDDGIDLRANPEGVSLLFTLVNLIVENQISLPRRTEEFYNSLPESRLEAIERRDEKKSTDNGNQTQL